MNEGARTFVTSVLTERGDKNKLTDEQWDNAIEKSIFDLERWVLSESFKQFDNRTKDSNWKEHAFASWREMMLSH